MALFLFHSSACSHHKIEPDKAHRQPLNDVRAAPKAERAPERSLILTAVHERKRLRDSSSKRSEGRLAPARSVRGELGLCVLLPISFSRWSLSVSGELKGAVSGVTCHGLLCAFNNFLL